VSDEPFAVLPHLGLLNIVKGPRLQLAIALRSYPSARRNDVYASWADLGERARLISPGGNLRHVREAADRLRDLGLLEWEERPGTTNLYTLLGLLAEGSTLHASGAPSEDSTLHRIGAPHPAPERRTPLHLRGAPRQRLRPRTEDDEDRSSASSPPLRGETQNPTRGGAAPGAPQKTNTTAAAGSPPPDDEIDPDLRGLWGVTYLRRLKEKQTGERLALAYCGNQRKPYGVFEPEVVEELRPLLGEQIRPDIDKGTKIDGLLPWPTVEERMSACLMAIKPTLIELIERTGDPHAHVQTIVAAVEQDEEALPSMRPRLAGWVHDRLADGENPLGPVHDAFTVLLRQLDPLREVPPSPPPEPPVEPVEHATWKHTDRDGFPITDAQIAAVAADVLGAEVTG
jgi:hypothetical protein